MKRQKLLKHIRAHGCVVAGEGRRHTRVENPANHKRSFVPRHIEIKAGTAAGICKELEIPPPPEK